jgi:hypothetical protein
MIRRVNVNVRNAAIKAVWYQSALYFVPDFAQSGVEFLSQLLVVHGVPHN